MSRKAALTGPLGGTTHLTVGQVSCLIYRVHVGAGDLAAVVAETVHGLHGTTNVLTPPIGRILFGQRGRCEELGGEHGRRGVEQRARMLLLLLGMWLLVVLVVVRWLMRGHYGLVRDGAEL